MKTSVLDAYKSVMRGLRERKFAPVYLLHGEEPYFIDRVAGEIERTALEEHERDFNLTVLYGRDSDPDQVRDACLRYPMMAERQVVVVREAQAWTRKEQWEAMEPYLKKPTPTTVLVIAYKHKKMDGRWNAGKLAAKAGVSFHSEKLREEKLPEWVNAYVKHMGRSIGPREALLLSEHLGSDLGKVTKEVEKLCLVTQPGTALTAEVIQRYVGISKEHNVFELQKALGQRDRTKAMRIAKAFAQDPKDHPLVVTVALLHSHFAKLAMVHDLGGADQATLASRLGVPPFFVRDYQAEARNFSREQLITAQHHLHLTDLRSKGVGNHSAGEGELLMELVERMLN